MEPEKTKLLVIGWGAHATGLGRVLESISSAVGLYYDIKYFALDKDGVDDHKPWTVIPRTVEDDRFGVRQLPEILHTTRPDIVLIHFDFWLYQMYRDTLKQHPRLKVILYFPCDGEIFRADPMSPLLDLDYIIPYTHYGKAELLRVFGALGALSTPQLRIIGHGLDHNTFFPLDEKEGFKPDVLQKRRQKARRMLFGENSGHDDDFIVLNASANRPRKCLGVSIRGFDLFVRDKPSNIKLYIHTNIVRNEVLFDLDTNLALNRLWKEKRLLLTTHLFPGNQVLSDEQLNLLYNACDIGMNTASGEGWGLISCEHGATGAAQMVVDHTNLSEIWGDSAVMMQPFKKTSQEMLNITLFHVEIEEVARKLELLWSSSDALSHFSESAYLRMHDPEFQGEKVASQWLEMLKEVQCYQKEPVSVD